MAADFFVRRKIIINLNQKCNINIIQICRGGSVTLPSQNQNSKMPSTRKHNRLPKYDYSQSNYYFITSCAENKQLWFGEIINDKMVLNSCGQICLQHLQNLPNHYRNLAIDLFVIMPNHVHVIFIILSREGHRPSPTYSNSDSNLNSNDSLTDIMRGFKTFSANQINKTIQSEKKFKWQKSFHDHIIRNESSLQTIREYIVNNPATWTEDEENINRI